MREDEYIATYLPEHAATLKTAQDGSNAARAAVYAAQQAFQVADEARKAAKRSATSAACAHFAEHQRPTNAAPQEIIQRIADLEGVNWRGPKKLVGWSAGRQVFEQGDLIAPVFNVKEGLSDGVCSPRRPAVYIEPMKVGTGRSDFLVWVNAGRPRSIYLDTGTIAGQGQRKRRVSVEDCEALARIVGLTTANHSGTQGQEVERGDGD